MCRRCNKYSCVLTYFTKALNLSECRPESLQKEKKDSQNNTDGHTGKSRSNRILIVSVENFIVRSSIGLFLIRFNTEIHPRKKMLPFI